MTYSDNYNRELLAEIYDQCTNHQTDLELIRSLIEGKGQLKILECFSGTGRISIPLLAEGHFVTGIELALAMAERARTKARALGQEHFARLNVMVQDVLGPEWGTSAFDIVVIGCNALFELSSKKMQLECITRAYQALLPGGYMYIDNGNWTWPMEKEVGRKWIALEGTGSDGTYARQSAETTAVDTESGIMHIKRTWYTRTAEGLETSESYMGCKRPISGQEVEQWLINTGFIIKKAFGDTDQNPFGEHSDRAIFWAQKPE